MKVLNNGLFILLLLFISSCQKENSSNKIEPEKGIYLSTILIDEHEHGESLNFENDYPNYYRDLTTKIDRFSSRNSLFTIEDIDFTNYSFYEDSISKVYTFLIRSQWQDRFFNLRYEIENDKVTEYVLEIKPLIMNGFYGNENTFTGTISKILMENAFNDLQNGGDTENRCCDDDVVIIYCWKLIFENGIDKGYWSNPDGTGTGSDGGGSGGSGGGGSGGGEWEIEFFTCACAPHHTYGENCNCKKGKPGWRIVRINRLKDTRISSSSRDWVECLRLLTSGGFITPAGGTTTTTTPNSTNCASLAQEFINTYGLNITVKKLSILVGGFGNSCSNQNDFDEYVKTKLIEDFTDKYPDIDLTNSETNWLKDNFDYFEKLIDFIDNRTDLSFEAREKAVETYIKLLSTVPSFKELDELWPTIPAFVWPFIKDIGAELGAELFKALAKKYTPAGQVESVIDAIKALGQGELLDFIGEVFDIIKTKFPAGALIDAGIESYDLYQRAEPVWKAISKMEQFGGEVIEKFLTVIKGTGGNILDKFKWKGGNIGSELFDVGDPNAIWNQFKNLFPDIQGPYPNPSQPLEQTYRVLNQTIEIKFYPESNTTGSYTMSIRVRPNGLPFKIRFL